VAEIRGSYDDLFTAVPSVPAALLDSEGPAAIGRH